MKVCGHPLEVLSLFAERPTGANPLCMISVEPVCMLLWERTGGVWHMASHPPS